MIQIELPCCDATVVLEPEARMVRCEVCAIEHLLAADARAIPPQEAPQSASLVAAAA